MKESFVFDDQTARAIPLFAELSERERGELLAFCSVKRYAKNAMIFFDGDDYAGFYVVLKGSVKVFKNSPDGKEYIVHLLHPFSLLAEVPVFEGGNYPANAQALESAALLFVPKRHFLEALQRTPPLTQKILVGFAKKIRTLSQQLENLTLHDVGCRLARYLVRRVEEAHREDLPRPFIRLDAPKSAVAAHLGTVIETFSRTLKKLQTEKIIGVNGNTITVLDYRRLRALAEYPPFLAKHGE